MTTTTCSNCQRYAYAIKCTDGFYRLFNIANDGFTATEELHRCGESDRRHA